MYAKKNVRLILVPTISRLADLCTDIESEQVCMRQPFQAMHIHIIMDKNETDFNLYRKNLI